jgi:hypothetical protein
MPLRRYFLSEDTSCPAQLPASGSGEKPSHCSSIRDEEKSFFRTVGIRSANFKAKTHAITKSIEPKTNVGLSSILSLTLPVRRETFQDLFSVVLENIDDPLKSFVANLVGEHFPHLQDLLGREPAWHVGKRFRQFRNVLVKADGDARDQVIFCALFRWLL